MSKKIYCDMCRIGPDCENDFYRVNGILETYHLCYTCHVDNDFQNPFDIIAFELERLDSRVKELERARHYDE